MRCSPSTSSRPTSTHTSILPLTEAISEHAAQLIDQHTLASGLQLGDALIAATVLTHQLPLLTGNTKHFAPITDLKIEAFVPEARVKT